MLQDRRGGKAGGDDRAALHSTAAIVNIDMALRQVGVQSVYIEEILYKYWVYQSIILSYIYRKIIFTLLMNTVIGELVSLPFPLLALPSLAPVPSFTTSILSLLMLPPSHLFSPTGFADSLAPPSGLPYLLSLFSLPLYFLSTHTCANLCVIYLCL